MIAVSDIDELLTSAPDGAAALRAVANAFAASDLYFGHGTQSADDEAAWLIAAQTGVDYAAPDWHDVLQRVLRAPLPVPTAHAIAVLTAERINSRKPLAYLLGEAWFAGLRFSVNEHVLVPRSPIAELIATGFAPWIDPSSVQRVLDIGTGSGCIAIATALALPHSSVDASDVSAHALDCAATNVARYDLQERVRLVESDVYQSLAGQCYDLIVTNPPYVDADEMARRPAEYRHEPELGLAAGYDGLSIARQLLAESANHLNDGGHLILEVGASDEALQREYPQVPFMWIEFENDARGVTIMDKETLLAHRDVFNRRAEGQTDAGQ